MQGGAWGWDSPAALGLLGAAIAALSAFAWWERRHPDPLVDLTLLRTGDVAVVAGTLGCVQFCLAGLFVFGAIWVQQVLGFRPIEAGLSLLPLTLALLVTAPLAGRLYDRVGVRLPLTAGALLLAAGLASTAAVVSAERYELIVPGYVAMGIGFGLTTRPARPTRSPPRRPRSAARRPGR